MRDLKALFFACRSIAVKLQTVPLFGFLGAFISVCTFQTVSLIIQDRIPFGSLVDQVDDTLYKRRIAFIAFDIDRENNRLLRPRRTFGKAVNDVFAS